jgi:peptide/nickel transport system substrate-binding protein
MSLPSHFTPAAATRASRLLLGSSAIAMVGTDGAEALGLDQRAGGVMRRITIWSLVLLPLWPSLARATEAPRHGGELTFVVPAEPPSYDAHREETFALIHPAAPHYNTLLRVDPSDPSGTKLVGDLAESWTIAADGLLYTITLRQDVRFHDGSQMSSRDVKASYDKIIFPPPGVGSPRKGSYEVVEAIAAPTADTVVFRLKWPSGAFLSLLASPWNWIYKADILASDIRWYETHVMGTGPFVFVEHVKGSRWIGRKNPTYWDKGKPYLDRYRAIFIKDPAAQVAAIRSERAMIQFRGFSPAARDALTEALGPKLRVQESPWNCALLVVMNHERTPFGNKRVRRALTLAIDRHAGSRALSKTSVVSDVAGVQVRGTPYATPLAALEKVAGYWDDIEASRREARTLLREAAVPDGFGFTFKNLGVQVPYEALGNWLIEQWRAIGLNVTHQMVEPAKYFTELRGGRYHVAIDFQCGYIVEPDLDLSKFRSTGLSRANYARYTDKVLDDLYQKQSRTIDREERKKHVRAFERRLLDEEAHYLYTLRWHRIVPHLAKVRGWTITPSHYLNNQLDTVWLAE